MTAISINTQHIVELAREWAANVVGSASTLISSMLEKPENQIIHQLSDKEFIIFMMAYLDHLIYTYAMQMRAITAKMSQHEDKMQESGLQQTSPE